MNAKKSKHLRRAWRGKAPREIKQFSKGATAAWLNGLGRLTAELESEEANRRRRMA
ncbi:hypothetical protein [Zavarzinia sp.]|uniref:hypothetical protein n=1 Tax=Zavarzinia sp. TaxID=2027920 RepID=UPI00356A036A